MPLRRSRLSSDGLRLLLIPLVGGLMSCAESPTTVPAARPATASQPSFSEAPSDEGCIFGPSFVPNPDVGYLSVCPYVAPNGATTILGTGVNVELLIGGQWVNDGGGSASPGGAFWMGDVHFRQGATAVRLRVGAVHVFVDANLRYQGVQFGGPDPDNDWYYFSGPGIYHIYPDITIEPSVYELLHQTVKNKLPQKSRYIIRTRSAANGVRG